MISAFMPPLLLFLAPITGVYSISFFANSMLEKMHMGNPTAVAIGLGLIRTFGTALGGGFVQKCGRRLALIISSVLLTAFLVIVSVLLLLENTLPRTVFNWVMIILLVLVMFFTSIGITPTPWILLGEWPDIRDKVRIRQNELFIHYYSELF